MDEEELQFPEVFHWISHLPPPSLWSRPSLQLLLFDDDVFAVVRLIVQRTQDGCVSFFLEDSREKRVCWRRDIKWSNEEDSNHNNMQLVTSPLLSAAIASIFHAIRHRRVPLYRRGIIDPRDVAEDSLCEHSSITQSSNYPLLFNSAFASMCIRLWPRLILNPSVRKFISREILHRIDSGPLTRLFGSVFTFTCYRLRYEIRNWEPLSWSYARNTCDAWEIKIYCPLLSMITTHNHLCEFPKTYFPHLRYALALQQLECIVQLRYDLTFKGKFIHLQLGIQNVRCDVRPYENPFNDPTKDLLSTERYFPSKISITIAPRHPSGDLKISVNRSSANPTFQIATGDGWEASYQPPKEFGVKTSASTSSTRSFSSWEFEASADGVNGTCQWILHDTSNVSGTKVISSKPSRVPFFMSKTTAWYRDRYRKAASPFNEQGGVVFAGDEYSKAFTWTLNKSMESKTFKCKIEGTVWLTYWPNLCNTSFYESRYHQFSEIIELPLTGENCEQ